MSLSLCEMLSLFGNLLKKKSYSKQSQFNLFIEWNCNTSMPKQNTDKNCVYVWLFDVLWVKFRTKFCVQILWCCQQKQKKTTSKKKKQWKQQQQPQHFNVCILCVYAILKCTYRTLKRTARNSEYAPPSEIQSQHTV